MSPDWGWARRKFESIVDRSGVTIQWLQRSVDYTDAYNTSSQITFGYSDPLVTWTTGSCKALIQHISAEDKIEEAGFWQEDFEKIFVDPDTNIQQWEQIILPSGSGIRYLIRSIHDWRANGDVLLSRYALVRRLVPRSGSGTGIVY